MKKCYTLLALVSLISLTAFGQITINSGDVDMIGSRVFQAFDTLPDASIVPGPAGSASWNFTALQIHGVSLIEFYNPSKFPALASRLPAANIIGVQDTSAFIFLKKDSRSLDILATYVKDDSVEILLPNNPPSSLIRFPATYGGGWQEVVKSTLILPGALFGVPVDSVRIATTSNTSVQIDGFGTMRTPMGSFNSLRLKDVTISLDTIAGKLFGSWLVLDAAEVGDTSVSYTWWTNSNKLGFPVCQLETFNDVVISASWMTSFTTGTAEPRATAGLKIYPNPVADVATIQMEDADAAELEIYDFSGKLVSHRAISSGTERIEAASLQQGTHLAVVKARDGAILGFEKFEVVK